MPSRRHVAVVAIGLVGLTAALGPLPSRGASAAATEPCPFEDVTPLSAGEERARAAMYCLISRERVKAGRRRLTVNRRLEAEAGTFATQMVTEQFFSHVDPQGQGLTQRTVRSGYLSGYDIWALGENIGWGSGALGTPKAMMTALMNSRGHRRNLLSTRYRNMGVGVSTGIPIGGRFGATYVQQFGWRSR